MQIALLAFWTIGAILYVGHIVWIFRRFKLGPAPKGAAATGFWANAVGLQFLVIGFFTALYTCILLATGAKTNGTVVEILERKSEKSENSTPAYTPVVAFTNTSGARIQFQRYSSSNADLYKVGEQVPVIYNISRPEGARIDSFLGLWMLPLMTATAGTACLIIAILLGLWQKLVKT